MATARKLNGNGNGTELPVPLYGREMGTFFLTPTVEKALNLAGTKYHCPMLSFHGPPNLLNMSYLCPSYVGRLCDETAINLQYIIHEESHTTTNHIPSFRVPYQLHTSASLEVTL